MHRPITDHCALTNRLLCSLCSSLNDGIFVYRDSLLSLHAFSDVDWAGNKDDFIFTSAYIVYLGRNPIS